MNNITIRQIQKEDNLGIAQMIRGVFEEHNAPTEGTVFTDPTTDNLFELFKTQNSIFWIAIHHEKIWGCCGIYPTQGLEKDCIELVKFYLPAEARGKGIGKKLMECCVQSAKELGYQKLYLESIPAFAKAVSIYEKLGFIHLEKPLGNSGHNGCDIWMLQDI